MAEYIRVSTRQIDQDRERIEAELKGARNAVEELYQEMQQLGQTWEGPAWQTFQRQVASDIENMRNIDAMMAEYMNHMEFASMEYKQCESKMEELVGSIRI